MPNKKRQKEVGHYSKVKAVIQQLGKKPLERTTEPNTQQVTAIPIIEEKVEVIIKEVIRIKPTDFSAFKHALEEFVAEWDI